MPACPNGHQSADEEFCEVCGLAMTGAPPREPEPQPERPCPNCGAPVAERFCESCGHDSLAAPPPRAAVPQPPPSADDTGPATRTWTATVSADRAYYNSVMAVGGPDADGIEFPPFCPDRYFPLRAGQITVGRRSASRGINPDIDLTGPPEDPGVSHLHAVLLMGPDGGLSIVDLGSSNGTTVNSDQNPLRTNVPRALSNGDQVHLGAWTTITVRSDD
jgi:hypothetical protein